MNATPFISMENSPRMNSSLGFSVTGGAGASSFSTHRFSDTTSVGWSVFPALTRPFNQQDQHGFHFVSACTHSSVCSKKDDSLRRTGSVLLMLWLVVQLLREEATIMMHASTLCTPTRSNISPSLFHSSLSLPLSSSFCSFCLLFLSPGFTLMLRRCQERCKPGSLLFAHTRPAWLAAAPV